MAMTTEKPVRREISRTDGRALLDKQARRYLNISGDEFMYQWDAGRFIDNPDRPEVMRVAMLLDLAR